jgi:hypothetical protein
MATFVPALFQPRGGSLLNAEVLNRCGVTDEHANLAETKFNGTCTTKKTWRMDQRMIFA